MIEVLTLADKEKWFRYLEKMPELFQDIYYSPEYYTIFEKSGYGKALCFVQSLDDQILLYPFLINEINNFKILSYEKYYDIQGAYGYNGFLCNTNDAIFISTLIENFTDFCNKKNIIAEFTRFNPIIQNESIPGHLEVVFDQENIILNLKTKDIEKNEYDYSTRKNIKKAIRSGLKSIMFTGENISEEYLNYFCDIYYATMDRNNADSFYYFSNDYFKNLISLIPNNSKFYFAIFNDKIVSTELILYGINNAYSFLGGTLKEYFEYRPNDFLKDVIIKDLIKEGKEYYCLGGGSDGVIRYKKTFSKNGVWKFCFGKKIHNQQIYHEIIKAWEYGNPIASKIYSGRILKYRYCDK
jgi:hypothetical protein